MKRREGWGEPPQKISISLLECSGSKLPVRGELEHFALCIARCRKAKEQLDEDGEEEELFKNRCLLSYTKLTFFEERPVRDMYVCMYVAVNVVYR